MAVRGKTGKTQWMVVGIVRSGTCSIAYHGFRNQRAKSECLRNLRAQTQSELLVKATRSMMRGQRAKPCSCSYRPTSLSVSLLKVYRKKTKRALRQEPLRGTDPRSCGGWQHGLHGRARCLCGGLGWLVLQSRDGEAQRPRSSFAATFTPIP